MVTTLGAASATVAFAPDPPVVGTSRVTVTLSGAPTAALDTTTLTFASSMPSMPSMAMAGSAGAARRIASGRYVFDLPIGMATTWSISLHASGGVNGSATVTFVVAGSGDAGGGTMSGMNASGDVAPWRTAALLLLGLGIAALAIFRRQRTGAPTIVLGVAAIAVIAAAIVQSHANGLPSSTAGMDMNAMNDVPGNASPSVATIVVRSAVLNERMVSAPGQLAPYLTQDIVTRSAGIVHDFSAYAGDRVRAGQVLAQLEEPELAARAASSEADAEAQRANSSATAVDAARRAPAALSVARDAELATERDVAGAAADVRAKAERSRYWRIELAREASLLHEGAVSQQEYEDERAQAAAALADAEMAHQRYEVAQRNRDAARSRVADAEAGIAVAQQQAAMSRAQAARAMQAASADAVLAGYTTVSAPSDGVVVRRLVDPGVYVAAGTPIARIAVIDRLRVQANVAQEDLAGITVGSPVSARAPTGRVYRGRVSSIAPVADPSTRTSAVEAIVENVASGAVPGGYVDVRITVHANAPPGAVAVPSAALSGGTATPLVWTVANGIVHGVPVTVVRDDGTNAIVRGGIRPGMHIVADGAAALQENETITELRS